MTFCVDLSARALRANASWGQYKRETREDGDDAAGKPKRIWQRYPRGGHTDIDLKDGSVEPVWVDATCKDVFIKGRVRKRATHWSVTLFLVNGQEPSRPRDEAFLFQPELSVTAADGSAIFRKRLDRRRPGGDPATRLEEDTLEMIYRRHVEFAVGHGGQRACGGVGGITGPRRGGPDRSDPEIRASDDDARERRRRCLQSCLREARRSGPRHEGAGRDSDRRVAGEAGAVNRSLRGVDRPGGGEDRRPLRRLG